MALPSIVQFSVRTKDDSSLDEVAARLERIFDLRFTPYEGKYFDIPVLQTRILGLWVVLLQVQSVRQGAPARFQFQARQAPDDDEICEVFHDISDYVMRALERREPGRWYLPSEGEVGVDVGLE
jgi:hypothetical protein